MTKHFNPSDPDDFMREVGRRHKTRKAAIEELHRSDDFLVLAIKGKVCEQFFCGNPLVLLEAIRDAVRKIKARLENDRTDKDGV